MMSTEALFGVTVLIRRRLDIPEDYLHRYWAHTHGSLASE